MPRSALRSARTRAPSTWERVSGMGGDLQCLGADLFDQPFFQADEFGSRLDPVGSRMGQINEDLGLDAAGTRAHYYDAAAKEDGLLNVVGDEQHGLLLALPDPEQHFLHQRAGLII